VSVYNVSVIKASVIKASVLKASVIKASVIKASVIKASVIKASSRSGYFEKLSIFSNPYKNELYCKPIDFCYRQTLRL
jgi:hypothetical protein